MQRKVTLFFAILILTSILPISLAHAQEDINLLDLPQQVADYFGITEFAAKYLVSGVALLFATMLIGFIMRKGPGVLYSILIVDFVLMAFFVALAWIDYWVFLILCLLVALMMAGALKNLISGDK